MLKEIGRGDRVALAKLAVEHLERTQRPLRVAIDAAIWNFQAQSGQGGKNPALRTLYYRLLRLLALPIHPLFVYDGTDKPLTKRGQTVSRYGTCLNSEMSKKLMQQFRFPCHTAPGEAEAECAQLQKHGLVDMVMSQDGDAIMFGSNLTLRNWSKEVSRGNNEPTHVDLLDLQKIKAGPALDPDGMILVAMLSGGDYNQQGLPGFGVLVACDIARAGFGTDLLNAVKSGDEAALIEWRERLTYELESNESGYFKKRHKTLKIPDSFPDRKILDYYTNPAVSSRDIMPSLEQKWTREWQAQIDVPALRLYVGQMFDWRYKPGAWKLVRTLSRPLLANRLQNGTASRLVCSTAQISERREHYTTGGIPELRIAAVPADIVGLDLDTEEDSPEYLAALENDHDSDNERTEEGPNDGTLPAGSQSPAKASKPRWNPYVVEKMWLSETQVELGVPALLEEWNQQQRDRLEAARAKTNKRKPRIAKSKSMPIKETDRIDQYFAASRTALPTIAPKNPTVEHEERSHLKQRDNISTSTAPATPIKSRTRPKSKPAIGKSPDLKQYFQPAKAGSRSVLLEGVIRPEDNSLKNLKHSRPSSSTSMSKDDWDLPATISFSTVGSFDNPFALTSSPAPPSSSQTEVLTPFAPVMVDIGMDASRASLPLREVANSVTQRSTRRSTHKKFARSKTEGADPDEDSQPIEDVMSPNASLSAHTVTSTMAAFDGAQAHGLPLELETGLKFGFGRRKVFALPRESLEGTWKEMEAEEDVASPTSKRRGRVSCVALDSD